MRRFYSVLFFFLPIYAVAQRYYELKTFYETINAKSVSRKVSDLGFSGNVRSVKETVYRIPAPGEENNDTITVTRYHFTGNGLLDSLLKGDTSKGLNFSRAYYEIYDYDRESGKLKSYTVYNGNYYAQVTRKKFNAEGFVTSERFDAYNMKHAEQLGYTADYTYRNNFSELAILYRYDLTKTQYDRRDDGTWKFTFNNAGQLTAEVHQEEEFSSSLSMLYDPKWTLPTSMFYIEHCATANSCLNLTRRMKYDDQGRKTREELSDATIRNSLWRYDYCYGYKYDARGSIIKQTTCSPVNINPFLQPEKSLQAKSSPTLKLPPIFYTAFEYVYDAAGNWVERKEYAVNGRNKVLVNRAEREVVYY